MLVLSLGRTRLPSARSGRSSSVRGVERSCRRQRTTGDRPRGTRRGFVHLATGLDDEVFKQLTAEKMVAVQKRVGLTSYEWRKSPQDRNEVLDCAVYARAAAYSPHIGMGRMTLAQWEALAIKRGAPPEPAQLDMLRAVAVPAGAAAGGSTQTQAMSAAPIRVRKSRYLS